MRVIVLAPARRTGQSGAAMADEETTPSEVPTVLTSSRARLFALSAAGVVFVAMGISIVQSGRAVAIGWFAIAFFGAALILFVLQLVVPGRLLISHDAIEVHQLWRHWSRDLARCGRFEVWRYPFTRHSAVVFDHPEDQARRGVGASRRFGVHSSLLPETYGKPAKELAAILNQARTNALSAVSDSAP